MLRRRQPLGTGPAGRVRHIDPRQGAALHRSPRQPLPPKIRDPRHLRTRASVVARGSVRRIAARPSPGGSAGPLPQLPPLLAWAASERRPLQAILAAPARPPPPRRTAGFRRSGRGSSARAARKPRCPGAEVPNTGLRLVRLGVRAASPPRARALRARL